MRRAVLVGIVVAGCGSRPAAAPTPPPAPPTAAPAPQPLVAAPAAATPASDALPDRDHDGIADAYDACEDMPGYPAGDGCPGGRGPAMPPFQPLIARSPHGAYEVRVARTDGGPAWIEVTELASGRQALRVRSVNWYAPRLVLVTDDARVVTLDEYAHPVADHLIVIYGPAGAVVADLSAEQVLEAREHALASEGWWAAPPALADHVLHVTTPWHAAFDIDLVTGEQRRGGKVVAMPTREQRLEQYLAGTRAFDSIIITLLHRRAQGYVCYVEDTRGSCSAASSTHPVGNEERSHKRRHLLDELRRTTALASCVLHPDAKHVMQLQGLDAGLVHINVREAGHTYEYDLRSDGHPACIAAAHVLEAIAPGLGEGAEAPPAPVAPIAENHDIDDKNDAALAKALAKRRLTRVRLPEESREDLGGRTPAVSADHVEVIAEHGTDTIEEVVFAEDDKHDLFHVVKKPHVIRRVPRRVCIAGPIRPPVQQLVRFAIPQGRTYKGDVEVTYDTVEIIPQNTCK